MLEYGNTGIMGLEQHVDDSITIIKMVDILQQTNIPSFHYSIVPAKDIIVRKLGSVLPLHLLELPPCYSSAFSGGISRAG
jgi:hypothetical protein